LELQKSWFSSISFSEFSPTTKIAVVCVSGVFVFSTVGYFFGINIPSIVGDKFISVMGDFCMILVPGWAKTRLFRFFDNEGNSLSIEVASSSTDWLIKSAWLKQPTEAISNVFEISSVYQNLSVIAALQKQLPVRNNWIFVKSNY
jgi:hypothetical protein